MQARAGAIEELTTAGALEDFTGGSGDDIDRELAALGQGAQVDDELAKMKAELGTGGEKKQLEGGE
jgi:phage shock protein A